MNRLQYPPLLLLCVMVMGCTSSSIPDLEFDDIPENALEIRVTGDMVPVEYFGEIRQELLRQAFEMPMQSDQRMFLVTDYKPIGGQLRMSIHLTVTSDVNGENPVAVFRAGRRTCSKSTERPNHNIKGKHW